MTTPLESRPLILAYVDMLETALPTVGIHWAGAPLNGDPPFAVLYPVPGMKSNFHRSLTNAAPTELRFQVTAVGATPEQATWVSDKVATALYAAVPSVAGRRVWPAVQESAQPVRRDDESTALFIATSMWLTRSDPT